MNDAPKVLRDWLIGQDAIATLFANGSSYRIHAETDVPPAGYEPADGPALCFKVRGGSIAFSDALLLPSVQMVIWAKDVITAQAAYQVVLDTLHNGRGATLRYAQCEILGQTLRQPETGWPYVLAYFQVSVAKD